MLAFLLSEFLHLCLWIDSLFGGLTFFYRWTYTVVPEHIHIASVCEVTYVCHTDWFTKGLLFLSGNLEVFNVMINQWNQGVTFAHRNKKGSLCCCVVWAYPGKYDQWLVC